MELDGISTSRLADTLRWAQYARQECEDLAFDALTNPGLESLEEPAAAAAEALESLLAAARTIALGANYAGVRKQVRATLAATTDRPER